MTLIKRLLTTIVLFVFFFVVSYFAICVLGGFVLGFMAGLTHANPGANIGADFVKNNIGMIALSSFAISLVASVILSFSGILSWCRQPPQPTGGSAEPVLWR